MAIGSSSTAGFLASSPSAAYPSVLQNLLAAHPEVASFSVYNKGLNGDTLPGTTARLQADALSLNPQLIVLQVGTNDSVNDPSAANLAAFKSGLTSTIQMIRSQASVVLMNGQYYPKANVNYATYQAAIIDVANAQQVAVFDRYTQMKTMIDSGQYEFKDILSSDDFHPNDLTYRCMAYTIADLILSRTATK